jgi:GT2 family glycosyltransferase
VIVPTCDRPEKLRATLRALAAQRDLDPQDYELIVVDDGSVHPVGAQGPADGPMTTVLRVDADDGPSAARNRGAAAARGELLVFVDDDMEVVPTFLASHWEAHLEWPRMLQVGLNQLPEDVTASPFGRFRQGLEHEFLPELAGPVDGPNAANYSPAANMAIELLGGFDSTLRTGEDHDLALRHTGRGGDVVFVPAAAAIHNDSALSAEDYCGRAERYMEELVRFGARHPDLPDTLERDRVNAHAQWGREPVGLSARKLAKRALLWPAVHAITLGFISLVERIAPASTLLDRLYRLHLGAHLQRGHRHGLRSADA